MRAKKEQCRILRQRKIRPRLSRWRVVYCACCTTVKSPKRTAAVNSKVHDKPALPQNSDRVLNKSTTIVHCFAAKNRREGYRLHRFFCCVFWRHVSG
ncbi:hypothetical protein Dda3937_04601 [Dickeya dadantii 3937]|uniref:Uncharacterized protein n=1 Tax=Dickeya dadantii (strain 3937) TaxID=198628 RepID=E0SE98_DICD3|nr:hypothetical protein Dda3937_04601 [Dickeya dadantii 3937]